MVNKERIYRYRQLLNDLNNSIIDYIDRYITLGKKYQILENFNATQSYALMVKGTWLRMQPMINSECTEREKEALWFYWNSITIYDYPSSKFEEEK